MTQGSTTQLNPFVFSNEHSKANVNRVKYRCQKCSRDGLQGEVEGMHFDLTKLLVNFQHASRYTVVECNEKYLLACQIQMASCSMVPPPPMNSSATHISCFLNTR